jgi:hypothetical protein
MADSADSSEVNSGSQSARNAQARQPDDRDAEIAALRAELDRMNARTRNALEAADLEVHQARARADQYERSASRNREPSSHGQRESKFPRKLDTVKITPLSKDTPSTAILAALRNDLLNKLDDANVMSPAIMHHLLRLVASPIKQDARTGRLSDTDTTKAAQDYASLIDFPTDDDRHDRSDHETGDARDRRDELDYERRSSKKLFGYFVAYLSPVAGKLPGAGLNRDIDWDITKPGITLACRVIRSIREVALLTASSARSDFNAIAPGRTAPDVIALKTEQAQACRDNGEAITDTAFLSIIEANLDHDVYGEFISTMTLFPYANGGKELTTETYTAALLAYYHRRVASKKHARHTTETVAAVSDPISDRLNSLERACAALMKPGRNPQKPRAPRRELEWPRKNKAGVDQPQTWWLNRCFGCEEVGPGKLPHYRRQCPATNQVNPQNSSRACSVSTRPAARDRATDQPWRRGQVLLDSAASRTCTNSKALSDFQADTSTKLSLADGGPSQVKGTGTDSIPCLTKKSVASAPEPAELIVENCLSTPGFPDTLISAGPIVSAGGKIVLSLPDEEGSWVRIGPAIENNPLLILEQHGNLFIVPSELPASAGTANAESASSAIQTPPVASPLSLSPPAPVPVTATPAASPWIDVTTRQVELDSAVWPVLPARVPTFKQLGLPAPATSASAAPASVWLDRLGHPTEARFRETATMVTGLTILGATTNRASTPVPLRWPSLETFRQAPAPATPNNRDPQSDPDLVTPPDLHASLSALLPRPLLDATPLNSAHDALSPSYRPDPDFILWFTPAANSVDPFILRAAQLAVRTIDVRRGNRKTQVGPHTITSIFGPLQFNNNHIHFRRIQEAGCEHYVLQKRIHFVGHPKPAPFKSLFFTFTPTTAKRYLALVGASSVAAAPHVAPADGAHAGATATATAAAASVTHDAAGDGPIPLGNLVRGRRADDSSHAAHMGTSRPGELVHCDWKPDWEPSLNGCVNLLGAIDDFSSMAYVLGCTTRASAAFIDGMNKFCGHLFKPEAIRPDNALEFLSAAVYSWAAANNIRVRSTNEYHPAQNRTERFWQDLLPRLAAMMAVRDAPACDWAMAAQLAAVIGNVLVADTGLGRMTPTECGTGRRPDVSNLRTFNCLGLVFVPPSEREHQHSATRRPVSYQGVNLRNHGHYCKDVVTGRITTSIDVIWLEHLSATPYLHPAAGGLSPPTPAPSYADLFPNAGNDDGEPPRTAGTGPDDSIIETISAPLPASEPSGPAPPASPRGISGGIPTTSDPTALDFHSQCTTATTNSSNVPRDRPAIDILSTNAPASAPIPAPPSSTPTATPPAAQADPAPPTGRRVLPNRIGRGISSTKLDYPVLGNPVWQPAMPAIPEHPIPSPATASSSASTSPTINVTSPPATAPPPPSTAPPPTAPPDLPTALTEEEIAAMVSDIMPRVRRSAERCVARRARQRRPWMGKPGTEKHRVAKAVETIRRDHDEQQLIAAQVSDHVDDLLNAKRQELRKHLPDRTEWRKVCDIRVPVGNSFRADCTKTPEAAEWLTSMDNEINGLIANGTRDLVSSLPPGCKPLRCLWVGRAKPDSEGYLEKLKSRITVKGFAMRAGIDYDLVFAPTVTTVTSRILQAVGAHFDWNTYGDDVCQAYIQEEMDKDNIYMHPPPGYETYDASGRLEYWHLRRALYGCKQSGRIWNQALKRWFTHKGWKRSKADPCLFICKTSRGFLACGVWVDDFEGLAEHEDEWAAFIKDFNRYYATTGKVNKLEWSLGQRITRTPTHVTIDQETYVRDSMHKFGMTDAKPKSVPISSSEFPDTRPAPPDHTFGEMLGTANFAATRTRPDISYACSVLGRYMQDPNMSHWEALQDLFRYMGTTADYAIHYLKGGVDGLRIRLWVDAGFVPDADGKSRGGYTITMCGGAIAWRAYLQPSVATSTMMAEYGALYAAICELLNILTIMSELGLGASIPPTDVYEDNMGVVKMSVDHVQTRANRHFNTKFHLVREAFDSGLIKMHYLNTELQAADAMTKSVDVKKIRLLCQVCGLRPRAPPT